MQLTFLGLKKVYYVGLLAEALAIPLGDHLPSSPYNGLFLLGLMVFGSFSSWVSGILLSWKSKNPLYVLFCIAVFVYLARPKY
jgi:hypothetical protein